MSNKWNPGCCDCCSQCTDYYSPNDWYLWVEVFNTLQVDTSHLGHGTTLSSSPYNYTRFYWDTPDLHTVLNAYLGTFQFPGTEPSAGTSSYKDYVFPTVFFPSVVAYGTVYMQDSPDNVTWSGWTARDIEFTNFSIQYGMVRNNCAGNKYRWINSLLIDFVIYEPDTLSEQDARMTFLSGAGVSCATLPLATNLVLDGAIETVPTSYFSGSGMFPVTYLSGNTIGVAFPLKNQVVGLLREYDITGFLGTTPPDDGLYFLTYDEGGSGVDALLAGLGI